MQPTTETRAERGKQNQPQRPPRVLSLQVPKLANFGVTQICPSPPSTLLSTPGMQDSCCEDKKPTTPATSSGCPNRFMGTCAMIALASSSKASLGSPVLPK